MKNVLRQYAFEIPGLGKVLPVYDTESKKVTIVVDIAASLHIAMPTEEELAKMDRNKAFLLRRSADECIQSKNESFFETLQETAFRAIFRMIEKAELILWLNRESLRFIKASEGERACYHAFCFECGRGVDPETLAPEKEVCPHDGCAHHYVDDIACLKCGKKKEGGPSC